MPSFSPPFCSLGTTVRGIQAGPGAKANHWMIDLNTQTGGLEAEGGLRGSPYQNSESLPRLSRPCCSPKLCNKIKSRALISRIILFPFEYFYILSSEKLEKCPPQSSLYVSENIMMTLQLKYFRNTMRLLRE